MLGTWACWVPAHPLQTAGCIVTETKWQGGPRRRAGGAGGQGTLQPCCSRPLSSWVGLLDQSSRVSLPGSLSLLSVCAIYFFFLSSFLVPGTCGGSPESRLVSAEEQARHGSCGMGGQREDIASHYVPATSYYSDGILPSVPLSFSHLSHLSLSVQEREGIYPSRSGVARRAVPPS